MADVRPHVRRQLVSLGEWLGSHDWKMPHRGCDDKEEMKTANLLKDLKIRRTKAKGDGIRPSWQQLNKAEVKALEDLLQRIITSSQACSDGTPHVAEVQGGEDARAAKRSRVETQAEVSLPANGKCVESSSSGVAQSAASCHEPRSPMVFMKVLEPIWATEVADGQKMFECVANKTMWHNQQDDVASGDLFIVVSTGRDKVTAVCEVASPAIVKETNREVLKSKLQESRHEALDAYLDGAESFDDVEFKHVFDCKSLLPVSTIAAFLERVGLALPKFPLVGLLRPIVIDAQWHSRLHKYMQQAVLRGPVDALDASHQPLAKNARVAR